MSDAAAGAASNVASGSASGSAAPLPVVMERASAYVDVFERTFSSLVTEERYVQVLKLEWRGTHPRPGQEPALAWNTGKSEERNSRILRRRQLLSDLLLVQPSGQMWIGYRDVAEVDGKPVRDRALRIEKLFLSGSRDAREELQRIAEESARKSFGSIRNVNVPTFPLQLLRSQNLQRFVWTTKAQSRSPTDPAACLVVGFREVAEPTIVTTYSRRNVPMTGQFCIEPDTGRVWRATISFNQTREDLDGVFEVTFRPTDRGPLLLPERVWEWSRSTEAERRGSPRAFGRELFVEGQATYSNIRQFTVITEEQPK